MLRKLLLLLFVLFETSKLYASEIPVIVIAPSKKPQSISTVGTSVTVFDEKFFEDSNELLLMDALDAGTTGFNSFQSGGPGTVSGIQLRGLPKRYSTIYIDGVKMSDPSSVSGEFELSHVLTNSISRVEILKGNQSSIYGSGAIGGTINITTKKAKQGFHKDISYNNGSNGTHNLAGAISGANKKSSYYIGLERFETVGVSATTTNDEDDGYKNNSLIANFEHLLSDTFKIKGSSRIAETYTEYDSTVASDDHNRHSDAMESSTGLSLIFKPYEKFTSSINAAKTYVKRTYNEPGKKKKYYGDRYAYGYNGNYNFNLDNSITFGIEREDDQIGYNPTGNSLKNESIYITSNYFDYQKRLSENTYATFGSRFDNHSVVGKEESYRTSIAHKYDNNTKLRASYGTGFRYPSLYEMYYVYQADKETTLDNLKAESSKSYDFGIEKQFPDLNINMDLSYFNIVYTDALEGWEGNTAGGTYTTANVNADVKSQGIELDTNWKFSDLLRFDLNYTYTSTYDGAEQDNPLASGTYHNEQLVRVPRNVINLLTNVKFSNYKKLNLSLNTKYADMARDYGNAQSSYADVRLDDYIVNDLSLKYNILDTYKIYLNLNNIFDEGYETVYQYTQPGRSLYFGIKKSY